MEKTYKNRKTIRLQTWDYRWTGAYFITICTKNKEYYFGDIKNGRMRLSQVGVIADILWYEIKNRVKNIELGEFVVMPNHVHGILILNEDNINIDNNVGTLGNVGTLHATSLPDKNGYMSSISPKSHSVSNIIRSYKSAVTKHANRLGFESAWQSRFHDHIIRDEKSFDMISDYIINNPSKWEEDKFYQKSEHKK